MRIVDNIMLFQYNISVFTKNKPVAALVYERGATANYENDTTAQKEAA